MAKRGIVELETDVLVLGGGFAGLWAAIGASDTAERVLLVDKAKVTKSGCSSFLAGVTLACFPDDDQDVWLREMVEGSDYLLDQEWVKQYLTESYERVVDLDRWAQEYNISVFEKDAEGQFMRKRSRAHISTYHIVVNAQPYMQVLKRRAVQRGVKIVDRVMAFDLVIDDGKVAGALGFNYRTGEFYLLKARTVILAAGGATFKGIFIGHKNLTGDMVAAAFRLGAPLKAMEQSTSNTCAVEYDIHGMNLMVNIGGQFVNAQGERFMRKYEPKLGNRAKTPALLRGICLEIMAGRAPIYLDATSATPEDRALCRKILPETFKIYDQIGYSPLDRPFPWGPAPYGYIGSGGGLAIDARCETSIPGLYAAGDAAFRACAVAGGPSGKASGFAIVSGYRAGRHAAQYAQNAQPGDWTRLGVRQTIPAQIDAFLAPLLRTKGVCADDVILRLQETLFNCPTYYIRSGPRLQAALGTVLELKEERVPALRARDYHDLVKANEAKNLVLIAEALLRSALYRQESRGWHYREDFPRIDNRDWLKHVLVRLEDGNMRLFTEDISTPYIRPTEEYSIPMGSVRKE